MKACTRTVAAAALIAAAVVAGFVVGRAQEARPLSDPETFSYAVRENLARAERVAHLYAYSERRTDVHTNPFGRIGTGGTRLFEVYPSATRRLIDRDGVALGAQELAEQNRKYREHAADVQRRLVSENTDERRSREEDAARARRRGERRIADVMETLQFRMDGRTVYEGVPAIVVSFTSKPEANLTRAKDAWRSASSGPSGSTKPRLR